MMNPFDLERRISRRDSLRILGRTAGLIGLGGFAQGFTLAPPVGGRRRDGTAFALIGDRYHNSDHYRTAFGKTFVRDMGLTMDFSDEVRLLNPDHLSRYRLLIILRDGINWPDGHGNPQSNAGWWSQGQHEIISDPPLSEMTPRSEPWMTEEMGRAVKAFVQGGGAALLMHNVTQVGVTNADFRDVLGAAYQGHPPIRPYRVRILNPNHPITEGVRDFVVTDEQHYMEYDKDRSYIFMESENVEGLDFRGLGPVAPAGWAFDYGSGRVCYMSPGHLITALWNPEYEKLQRNAARWLLREG
jgi:hypothetical protein